MQSSVLKSLVRRHAVSLSIGVLLLALLVKFLLPLMRFDVPLGYDVGMYRYLFLHYAQSLSYLNLPDLPQWAQEYPPALYVLFGILINIGLPVDAAIGWIWNLMPVFTLCVLAWVTAKRHGTSVGVLVLLVGFLSAPFYDGFYAMYWKTVVSLLLTVLTYYFAERLSPLFLLTALLTVLVHQQTGLVLILALGLWWLIILPRSRSNMRYRVLTVGLLVAAGISFLWYLPQWNRAILSPLKSIFLLYGDDAPPGTFPERMYYVRTMGILLLFGIAGFVRSFRSERGSLWQLSVLVCAVFVVFRFVFYQRFFLQLDFFLMPFAAAAIAEFWKKFSAPWARGLLVVLLLAQAVVSLQVSLTRVPLFSRQELLKIVSLRETLPPNAAVIALEDVSGPWLLGWLPDLRVGAPGLLDFPVWTYEDWQAFIDGSNADRKALLAGLQGPVYFFFTKTFTDYYGERADHLFNDPCLKKLDGQPLLESVCSS